MDKFVIRGGKPLFGEVTISGAKNAAVAIIPAAVMVDGVCRIENIPMVSDVIIQLEILRELYRAGTTVLLITHDENIAANAKRVVRLSDGRIISDQLQEVDWE